MAMEPDEPGKESPSMPADPFSDRQAGATGLHVMYSLLRSGGFTLIEGCLIIAGEIVINAAMGQMPKPPENS